MNNTKDLIALRIIFPSSLDLINMSFASRIALYV